MNVGGQGLGFKERPGFGSSDGASGSSQQKAGGSASSSAATAAAYGSHGSNSYSLVSDQLLSNSFVTDNTNKY